MTDAFYIFLGLVSRFFRNKAIIQENDKERPK